MMGSLSIIQTYKTFDNLGSIFQKLYFQFKTEEMNITIELSIFELVYNLLKNIFGNEKTYVCTEI